MADIQWPGSDEAILAMLKDKVNEHHQLFHGNGQPGVLDFIAGLKGQMRLIVGLLLFLSTLAAVGTLLIGIYSIKVGVLELPTITHSYPLDMEYSSDKVQDAITPPIADRR